MKRKLQKGFTLIELIVVMILMGILMTAVVMILRPSQNTFRNITNKAYQEQAALQISKLLNGSLRYSTGVKVVCNNGSVPTEAERGGHKRFIKLSNDYRDFNDYDKKAYYKGARGNFTRGKVDGTTLTELASAVNKATFDDYDFQFSIPEFNSKDEEASLTIALKAMPMAVGDEDEQTVAASINKPNPAFLPQWDKYFTYSETFEFINIRNKSSINKKTTGISVDPYNGGTPVAGLGGGTDFVDPRKANGSGDIIVDNTIWIFYTNPQEAEDKDPSGGGSPSTPGGSGSSGGTTGGTGGSEGASGGSGESGSTGATGPQGTGTPEDKTGLEDDPDANPTQTTENGSTENGGVNQNGGENQEVPPNTVEPKKDTYGSVTIVMVAKSTDNYTYSFNVSGNTLPGTTPSVDTSGHLNMTPTSSTETFVVSFTEDNQQMNMTGGLNFNSNSLKNENASDLTYFFYKGTEYDTLAEAEAARDGTTPPPPAEQPKFGNIYIKIIGASTDDGNKYRVSNDAKRESDKVPGSGNGEISSNQDAYINLMYTDETIGNAFYLSYDGKGELINTWRDKQKGAGDEYYYYYKGARYDSEAAALNTKAVDDAAAAGGGNPGGGTGTVNPSDFEIVTNGSTLGWGKAVYSMKASITNKSSSNSGPVTVTIKMTSQIGSDTQFNDGGEVPHTISISGDTLTIVLTDGIKAGETVKIWTNNNINIYSVKNYGDDSNFGIADISVSV